MFDKTNQTVQYVLVSLSLLALTIFGVASLLWHSGPGSAPAESPDITQASTRFAYDGPYVDIEAELARRAQTDASFGIALVDVETGLAAPLSLTAYDEAGEVLAQSVSVPMAWDGEAYDLVFRDDILVGYYRPDASLKDRLRGEMATDEHTRSELLDAYIARMEALCHG